MHINYTVIWWSRGNVWEGKRNPEMNWYELTYNRRLYMRSRGEKLVPDDVSFPLSNLPKEEQIF